MMALVFGACVLILVLVCLALLLVSEQRSLFQPRKAFNPSDFVEMLQALRCAARGGASLGHTILKMERIHLNSCGLLHDIHSRLSGGLTLVESLASVRLEGLNRFEKPLHAVLRGGSHSRHTLSEGLSHCLGVARSLICHIEKEKARTAQSRLQFFVLLALVPLLLLFNSLLFPSLLFQAISGSIGQICLGFGVLLYVVGGLLYWKMTSVGIHTKKCSASALKNSWNDFFMKVTGGSVLESEWSRIDALSSLQICLSLGGDVVDFLRQSSFSPRLGSFQESMWRAKTQFEELGDASVVVGRFALQEKGSLGLFWRLIHSFRADRAQLKAAVEEMLVEARFDLDALAEKHSGTLSIRLLLPLCFFLLPSAFCVLLAPVLQMILSII